MSIQSVTQREYHRINLDRRVNVEFENKSYDCCQITNLSLSGMCVAGNFEQKQAEHCRISFVHDEKPDKVYMQAAGTVIWGNEKEIGLQFTSMDLDHYQVLLTALINNAELPAVILSQIPKKCPF